MNIFKNKTIIIVIVLIIGFLAGLFFHNFYYSRCLNNFSLINPVFACSEEIIVDKKGYIEMKSNLISYIDKEKKEGRAKMISLFFRDLEGGPTLGINDRENFIPASLLKLPVVLTIFRLSEEEEEEEEEEGILYQKLMYNNENNLDNNKEFPPEKMIQRNVPYTVKELIERTIKYSDNFALELLSEHLNNFGNGRDLVADTYRDLGILEIKELNSASVSTKGYSSIFRMLYNSSFLNKKNSEKLLEILSESHFKEGLRAGVPEEIKIAHKFGEREINATGEKQLHDCGIVYYPQNPYLLCVMTKGKDIKDLKKIIGQISKEVYEEFNSRRLVN